MNTDQTKPAFYDGSGMDHIHLPKKNHDIIIKPNLTVQSTKYPVFPCVMKVSENRNLTGKYHVR